jgi:hypothetical protein
VKKIIFLLFAVSAILPACKKTNFSEKGPTDVRIENLQGDYTFYNVVVKTAGGQDTTGNIRNLGNIAPHSYSPYKRFAIAFSKAEISATINGETFTTGPINSTYMDYKGQMKITYQVYIKDFANKVIEINHCIPDAPLDSI